MFDGVDSRKARKACPTRLRQIAIRKLDQLNQAGVIEDLRAPPGNRLEALSGDRRCLFSIRINGQYRVCFRRTTSGPEEVEIVDYHG